MKYFKPNSKAAVKFAKWVKGVCAGLASGMFFAAGSKQALIVLIIGFLANEAINFFSAKKGTVTLWSVAAKWSMFIKGLCATITAAAYFEVGSNVAFIIAMVGFVANEGINAFGDGTAESPKQNDTVFPPESNEIKS